MFKLFFQIIGQFLLEQRGRYDRRCNSGTLTKLVMHYNKMLSSWFSIQQLPILAECLKRIILLGRWCTPWWTNKLYISMTRVFKWCIARFKIFWKVNHLHLYRILLMMLRASCQMIYYWLNHLHPFQLAHYPKMTAMSDADGDVSSILPVSFGKDGKNIYPNSDRNGKN